MRAYGSGMQKKVLYLVGLLGQVESQLLRQTSPLSGSENGFSGPVQSARSVKCSRVAVPLPLQLHLKLVLNAGTGWHTAEQYIVQ